MPNRSVFESLALENKPQGVLKDVRGYRTEKKHVTGCYRMLHDVTGLKTALACKHEKRITSRFKSNP